MLIQHRFLIAQESEDRIYAADAAAFGAEEVGALPDFINLLQKFFFIKFEFVILHFH